MPTNPQGSIVDTRKSKSLYTAVLYNNVPESSASSSTGEVGPCSSYLKRITREHLARASMEEVESSVAGSPSPESKGRVARLTERVRRAYSEANGNPADGRWSFISDLLQLSTTRGGRRWLDVNTAAEAQEIPSHLCIIPKTSEEWHELERKWKEEEDVKNKVQRWIVTAEFEPLTPEATVVQDRVEEEGLSSLKSNDKPSEDAARKLTTQASLKKFSTLTDPLNGGSKLGFSVVKRSSRIASGKPGPRKPQPPSQGVSPPPGPSQREGDAVPEHNPGPSDKQNQIPAVDHGDFSAKEFLPPSFSLSQVQTSTPLPGRIDHARKPSPIPFIESLSLPSPASSPKHTRTYGKPRAVLPVSPESLDPESSSPRPQGGVTGVTRKRSLSPSLQGGPAVKKARWIADEASSHLSPLPLPQPSQDATGVPVTPPKNLPRLKELLESAKRSRHEAVRTKRLSKAHAELSSSTEISGHGDGLSPPNAAAVEEQLTTTTSTHDSEPAFHLPGSTHISGPSPEAAEVEAEIMVLSNESKSGPGDAGSSPNAPVSGHFKGSTLAELSAHNSSPDDHVALRSGPQIASETESQPEVTIEEVLALNESQPPSPILPHSPKSKPFRVPSADPESLPCTHDAITYNLYGLDAFDNPSPAKSLSSLADAGSESDSDYEGAERTAMNPSNALDLLDSEFRPQLTSTQKPYADLSVAAFGSSLPSDGLVWGNDKLVSTSQLQAEVNSQVDELDKFMEADLGYDFVVPGL